MRVFFLLLAILAALQKRGLVLPTHVFIETTKGCSDILVEFLKRELTSQHPTKGATNLVGSSAVCVVDEIVGQTPFVACNGVREGTRAAHKHDQRW